MGGTFVVESAKMACGESVSAVAIDVVNVVSVTVEDIVLTSVFKEEPNVCGGTSDSCLKVSTFGGSTAVSIAAIAGVTTESVVAGTWLVTG